MEAQTAIELIRKLIIAEVSLTARINSSNTVPQSLRNAEHKAVIAVFEVLTGRKPCESELLEMTEL